MSKKCKVLALLMLILFSVGASAQVNPVNTNKWKNQKRNVKVKKNVDFNEEDNIILSDSTALILGRPNDNWYFGVSAGLHMFSGNEAVSPARINPLTPQIGVKFGKWLTPCIALSADLDLGYAKGQTRGNVYVSGDGNNNYQSFGFFYYDLYGEITLDWMNLTNSYARSSQMMYHLQNTIGMGYAWQTGKHINPNRKVSNYELSFHVGFNNDFRLNNRVTLFIEPKLAMVKYSWDGSPGHNKWGRIDYMVSLSFGAKFGLGKKSRHSFAEGSTVNVEKIRKIQKERDNLDKDLKNTTAEKNAQIDSLNDLVQELREKVPIPMKILDVIVEDNLKYISVYFRLDEAKVDYSTETSLKTFANRIKKSPEGTKFMIVSSADKATGTPQSNMILTQKRCDVVYNILVNKYGVSPDKFEKHPLGGIDHYEPDDMNRMTIVVESNDRIVEILRRSAENQKEY